MSIASEYESPELENMLLSHEFWEDYFEEIFESSSDAAESMIRLLYELLDGIRKGPESTVATVNTLKAGIEYAFQYTAAHKAALRLYFFYMDGVLRSDDEADHLIPRAIERAMIATEQKEKALRRRAGKSSKGRRHKNGNQK